MLKMFRKIDYAYYGLLFLGLLGVNVLINKDEIFKSKEDKQSVQQERGLEAKMIHEYFDLNRDGEYEYHRIVFERNGKIFEVYGNNYNGESSREFIESLPLIGHERRYFTP